MDAGDWIAIVALLISGAALYYSHRSANASDKSADAGQQSARAAHESAREAATISQIEAERRAEERERRHEELAPQHPGEIVAELVERDGHAALFGSIKVRNRAYRVEAVARMGASSTPIGLPLVLQADQPYRFMIEHWPPGQTAPKTQQVRIRFWPPVTETDDVDSWTCPCGRPLSEDSHVAGHWELQIPIRYEGGYDVLDSVH